ncbi:MAG: hypothetical protein SVY53_15665 [Chloroflexota bacterium]|nr:hypothetical protein [Chloroflexota bacterium]
MIKSKGRLSMKPVILVELLMVVLLAGAGSAFALSQNNIPAPGTDPWAGTTNITESGDLTVTDYSFTYSADLEGITEVIVEVTNSGAAVDADVKVAILDSVPAVAGSGELVATLIAAGANDYTVVLGATVDLTDMDTLNIILVDHNA